MYLTKEELLGLYIVKLPDTKPVPDNFDTYVSGTIDMQEPMPCFTSASINPAFARLFAAAPVMFQTCNQYVGYFKRFAQLFDEAGMPECAAELYNMKAVMETLLGTAVDGMEVTQERLANIKKLQIAKPEGKSN